MVIDLLFENTVRTNLLIPIIILSDDPKTVKAHLTFFLLFLFYPLSFVESHVAA